MTDSKRKPIGADWRMVDISTDARRLSPSLIQCSTTDKPGDAAANAKASLEAAGYTVVSAVKTGINSTLTGRVFVAVRVEVSS